MFAFRYKFMRSLPLLWLLGISCDGPVPPRTLIFVKDYLPETQYRVEAWIESSSSVRRLVGDRPSPGNLHETRQEVHSVQLLQTGAAADGAIPMDLAIETYETETGGGAIRYNLDGLRGRASYDPEQRRITFLGLAGELVPATGGGKADADSDSLPSWEDLSVEEAAQYMATSYGLLEAGLDSARTLAPGRFFTTRQPQQLLVGTRPVHWIESSTFTLDRLEHGKGYFSVNRSASLSDRQDHQHIDLEAHGTGRLVYNTVRRHTEYSLLETEMTIRVRDGAQQLEAESSSRTEIVTSFDGP